MRRDSKRQHQSNEEGNEYNKHNWNPHKDQSEQQMVQSLLNSINFQEYMLKYYQILPMLITKQRTKRFLSETVSNQKYEKFIQKWKSLSQQQKLDELQKKKIEFGIFSKRKMLIALPYLELYTAFILTNYKEEFEACQQLSLMTDLTMPHEWFPDARNMQSREIHYHMGPTNSGKTKTALDSLKKAKTGIYCAPLRLLAWEISENLIINGIPCDLITGQEKQLQRDATHISCTIEMANLQKQFDVAVIDEIQMISDKERGFAWTNALLGIQAKEIHLCGDERAFKLIQNLTEETGDKLFQHQYQRLSTLSVESKPISSFEDFKPGDCIVAFSRNQLLQLKKTINNYFNKKKMSNSSSNQKENEEDNQCAIIYGSLPPETKKNQAFLFNNRIGNIKYLVATDAIGMGLNLNIRRIIFFSLKKLSKGTTIYLDTYAVRQIGGRAGRYKQHGLVTAFKLSDLKQIRQHLDIWHTSQYQEENEEQQKQQEKEEISQREEQDKQFEKVFLNEGKNKQKKKDSQSTNNDSTENENVNDQKQNYDMTSEHYKIKRACLFPSFHQFQRFADDIILSEQRKQTLTQILKKFDSLSKLGRNYFLKDITEMCIIADSLEGIPDFSLHDQYFFAMAPVRLQNFVGKSNQKKLQTLRNFALMLTTKKVVTLPEEYHLDHPQFNRDDYTELDLQSLEETHNILEVYNWLGQKYEAYFIEQDLCKMLIKNICTIIDQILMRKDFKLYFDQMERGTNYVY